MQQKNNPSVTFVILRHVTDAETDKLWRRCLKSVKDHHGSSQRVIIIDDNSTFCVEDKCKGSEENTQIIQSEFCGAGEILPYYYYYKNGREWGDQIVVLHDSMFLVRKMEHLDKIECQFHWHFVDQDSWRSTEHLHFLFDQLPFGNVLKHIEKDKSVWRGCFGSAMTISFQFLSDTLVKKHNFLSLVPHITGRQHRMALERVIGCILAVEQSTIASLCGSIHDFPGCWHKLDPQQLKQLIDAWPKEIFKTWHGR